MSRAGAGAGAGAGDLDSRIAQLVQETREVFESDRTRPKEWRVRQLRGIHRLVAENADAIEAALHKDLGVNTFWAKVLEVGMVKEEANTAIANLDKWMAPQSAGVPLVTFPAKAYTKAEPFGTCLIISPWNYPVTLLLNPLIACVAAGNTAVLKPSEVSVNTSNLLATLLPKYVDPEAIRVVQGAIPESTALLAQRWDMIFYTGSTFVGKLVHQAAAKHLTPVVLELGGKCPVYVADDADLKKTAERLAWGKFSLNMGQSCVCPDYIMCTPSMRPKLIAALKDAMKRFYTDNPRECPDVSRIINTRHAERIAGLLEGDDTITIEAGGDVDVAERYIAPTLITATKDSKVMTQEIFGPILPVLTVADEKEAVRFIRSRPKPLSLYVFTETTAVSDYVLGHTSSGSAVVNDIAIATGNCCLPFGGVQESGTGSYHSIYGFRAFSHNKAVMVKGGSDIGGIRFPPYTPGKTRFLIKAALLDLSKFKPLAMTVLFGAAAVTAALVARSYGWQLW